MTPAPDDPFGLVNTRLDGKYEILGVVAEGGFGVVYQATHRALQKRVAVKVLKIPPELSVPARREFLAKFELEARTIAKFEHAAIVRVLDFGASPMPRGEAAPWMVLEWLEGTSLEAHLGERGVGNGIDPVGALLLLEPAFEAIAYAHEEGVVHRDLKPANLMLVRSKRGDLSLRVLDFGIAKLMGQEARDASGHTATSTATQAFTLPYAAPEQVTAMRSGPWTDVHALALILVEVLTGLAPITGNDVAELYASALSPLRPTPRLHGVDVGAWEPVLARALAFKPAERFPDARAFLEALRASLPGAYRRPLVEDRAPFQETHPAEPSRTLRGTSHPTKPRGSRSRRLFVGVAGVFVAVSVAGGSYFLATRGSPTGAERHAGATVTSAATAAPPVPAQGATYAVAPTRITPDPVRDAAVQLAAPVVAPELADHTNSRAPSRWVRARALRVGAPEAPRPTSSEQLPVE